MDEPRAPRPEEFESVMNFLSTNLRQGLNWKLADEYPLALTAQNIANVHIIEKEGNFISGAVVKTSLIKSPAGLFKVAGIGSVVTDPQYRNQGFSRSILESTLESAKAATCDIAILWSQLHDFYRKLGFEPAGSEVSLRINEPLKVDRGDLRFIESAKVSPEAILRLYSQHTCGTLRSVEDIRKCLAIPNMRVYTAWNAQNQLQAYAVEGKGADLAGHIHEWGGAVSKLLPLFSYIVESAQKPITVLASQHSGNLIRQLHGLNAQVTEGVLGMIKIVSPELICSKVRRYARARGFEDFTMETRQGLVHFGSGNNIYKTDQGSDLVRLIFGPLKAREIHSFDEATLETLEQLFPIPFWIWGWDSV